MTSERWPAHALSPALLDLARELGEPVPAPAPEPAIALSDPSVVVPATDPAVEAGLRALARERGPGTALRARARDAVAALVEGVRGVVLARGPAIARELAATAARRATGRQAVLAVGVPGVSGACSVVEPEAAEQRIASGDLAAVLVEPALDPERAAALAALCAAARSAGTRVVCDRTRTAFRGDADAAARLPADYVVLGASAACGAPFGAVAALTGDALPADAEAPDVLACALAAAALPGLREARVARELDALGERLRAGFAAACAEARLDARLTGPPGMMRFSFAGQEDADPSLLAHHFALELGAAGCAAEPWLLPNLTMAGPRLDRIEIALASACRRMRTLLIEHNSWLSGALDWVFPGGHPRLRERGLAIYRYTKQSAVDVTTVGEAVRIRFWPEASETTSSGFYVPTRIRGDFDVRVHYRLLQWRPGPKVACLALFVQNEPSTARYYAQRITSGSGELRDGVQGVMCGRAAERTAFAGDAGELRLTRRGAHVTAWHRPDAGSEWRRLADETNGATDDVIVGAKVWSEVECFGLEAELGRLSIEAEVPDDQIPALEPRPDPRPPSRGGPDRYSRETRAWLDLRFDPDTLQRLGVTLPPYQPVEGLDRAAWNGATLLMAARWIRLVGLLRSLSAESFLDVGGAEGMVAALVRDVTGVEAVSCDLSLQASLRAAETFAVPSLAAEAHRLPFADRSFDVVYLGEVVEHLAQPVRTVLELRRVARRLVVVTSEAYVRTEHDRSRELEARRYEPHMDRSILCPADFDALFSGWHVVRQNQIARLPDAIPHEEPALQALFEELLAEDSLAPPSLGIFVAALRRDGSGSAADAVARSRVERRDDVARVLAFARPRPRPRRPLDPTAAVPAAIAGRLSAEARPIAVASGVPDFAAPERTGEPLASRVHREVPECAAALLALDAALAFELPAATPAVRFFADGEFAGWTPSDGAALERAADGDGIVVRADAVDPSLTSPRLDRPRDAVRSVTLELATRSRTGRARETLQVFVHTLHRPLFCETLSAKTEYRADGTWQRLTVPLPRDGSVPDGDTLLWLRIDPADDRAEVRIRELTLDP